MFKRIFGLAGLLCALGVIGVGAGSASARTTNPFGCTAGTATASLATTNLLPGTTAANPANTPCATDTATLGAAPLSVAGALNLGTIGPARCRDEPVDRDRVRLDRVHRRDLDEHRRRAQSEPARQHDRADHPATATVSYQCVDNQFQPSFSSSLTAITINGSSVPIADISQDLPAALRGSFRSRQISTRRRRPPTPKRCCICKCWG